jgi:hypothetical protein
MTGPAPTTSYAGPSTAPAPAPARAPATPVSPVSHAAPHRRVRLSLIGARGTPAALQTLLVGLIIGSLVWGVVAALTASQHSSAAGEVASTSEPLSLAAQQMYQSLSEADVTATSDFLANPGPFSAFNNRQIYDADIANAAADLAKLRSAGAAVSSARLDRDLAAISAGLPVYTGYVQRAQTYSSLHYPLTGGSFIEDASAEMHVVLLPAASDIYAQESTALNSASAQATGLPLIVISILLALAVGYVLIRSQRWLTRRTHRRINPGLLLATVALAISTTWMAIAFVSARSDFGEGIGHGARPLEALAQASIAAQGGQGFEVLSLISNSGSTSFGSDFADAKKGIGPGSGSLLGTATADTPAGAGADAVNAAVRDAQAWYGASAAVFSFNPETTPYSDETKLVTATAPGSAQATFTKLEDDLRAGIRADQAVFTTNAASGSTAFDGLEIAVIIAMLAMVGGSAWGLSRRLAEYR